MQEFWIHVVESAMDAFSFLPLALFLCAAVVLLLCMRRLGLLRRPHRLHALFVSLYYLYLPGVFLLLGFTWAIIGTFEQAFLSACDQSEKSVREISVERTATVMEEINSRFSGNASLSLKELSLAITRAYSRQYGETANLDSLPEYVRVLLAPLVAPMQEAFAQRLSGYVEERVIRQMAASADLTPDIIHAAWETDVVAAMRDGLAIKLLKAQIQAFFPSYYQNVKFLFVLSLLPIAGETGLTFLVLALLRRFRARREKGKT
ncbi:MAG: hypothetical protein LBP61_06300 [Desulfovibrio sp.]|jgi:hypothetical protein|nr:hypothetical protein [Desulfovibrio sp.]